MIRTPAEGTAPAPSCTRRLRGSAASGPPPGDVISADHGRDRRVVSGFRGGGDQHTRPDRPAERDIRGFIPLGECRPGSTLPAGTEIAAYCRGACRVLACDAVRLLRAVGRAARHMEGGTLEWRLAGQPVQAA
jgi:hypothetical protein